jgi:PAS domain-containing protein
MTKKRPTISRLRNASGVGILLSDHREQALVQASTLACGLTPVLFSSPAEVQVYGEQNGPMLLLVTDDACLAGSLGFSSSFQLLMDFVSTRFILVHDGIESEQKEELSCSKKRRDDQHCWLWSRPLSAEVLKSEIASAGHAAKVIACKQRLILEELQRTRRIYDCMGNGVTISDASLPDHPLIYVNPAFERMTG